VTSPTVRVRTHTVDGKDVGAREDETILQVARENGIWLPTLCQLDGLSTVGACRLCVVEVTGTNKLLPACVTRVEDGMEVTAHSERLDEYRKMIVELLFAEGNHICSVCVANGNCELQSLAQQLGVDHIRFPYLYQHRTVDASHRRFALDQNRCILCTRCVRVCDEVEGAHTWDVMGRGTDARVITDLAQPWGAAESCTSCGKCVSVCPTGALFEKGKAVSEMVRDRDLVASLLAMRERLR
jgi:bidirectional [NiFe] hydrogenase diaphorase subunit